MRSQVMKYCQSCQHFQKRKVATHIVQDPSLSVYPKMTSPFDRCHIDVFGELPATASGYKYVLVFKCALTKWVEYFAVRNKSAEEIAECLVDEIILRHGAPTVIISDGGTEFANKILRGVCKLLEIRKITTAP